MKFYLLFFGLLFTLSISAEIREITHLDEAFKVIRQDSIVLIDLDDTLIESSLMLGGKAWRHYAVSFLKSIYSAEKTQELRDKMTYWIAQRVPCIAVENSIHAYLNQLKHDQIPVFGFTSRSRKYWNTLPCENGEELALLHLKQAGFDLEVFSDVLWPHPNFAKGIFFTSPGGEKGKLALEIFAETCPKHVVFIDDMISNVLSMEKAFTELGVVAVCFHYQHVDLYRSFDPLTTAIQLEKLHSEEVLLSDSEALSLRQNYGDCDPDMLLLKFIEYLGKEQY